MKDMYILGIESSCDETSASIVKNGTEEIATVISSQIDVHKDFGGVVPEIASRHHVKNVTMVLEECLEKANMTMDDIDAIAITYGPGLIGSLLIGLETAKTLAFVHNKPLIPVHHIAGHIYANSLVKELKFPLLAVVVSGGHTEIIEMPKHYSFNKLGGTLDDAIGECYDKVARVINVPYPGGPTVDKLAHIGKISCIVTKVNIPPNILNGTLIIYIYLSLLSSICATIVNASIFFGFNSYFLKLSRNEYVSFKELFKASLILLILFSI